MRAKYDLIDSRGVPFLKIEKAQKRYRKFKKNLEPIPAIHTVTIVFSNLGDGFFEANFYLEQKIVFTTKV